jgi:hypothetical protein
LITQTRQFKTVVKDRLFYNRYEYCLGFELDEASALRVLDHASIDSMIKRKQMWRQTAQQRRINNKQATRIHWRDITEDTVNNLHLVAQTLLITTTDFKLVVGGNRAWVYTNDCSLFDQLDDISVLQHKTYTQAQINRPRDSIRLQRSNYKFRTYFRFVKLTATEKNTLSAFLIGQQSHAKLSPSLKLWIQNPFNRVQDYFFVDYATDSWLTMLNLVRPGLVRKTLHIITDK